MKIRVLVEVHDQGRVTRRLKDVEVVPRVVKIYEAMGNEDLLGFIAEDVMTNAIGAVQPQQAMGRQIAGSQVGEGAMVTKNVEKELGLDLIEHMVNKGIV